MHNRHTMIVIICKVINIAFRVKSYDICRIWTCAGNPMRFLVSRLNHSAKLSVIHHSVHTGPFIRDWYITWSLLHHLTILYRYWKLYDFKNIQYRNSNHREINWPVWEFLLRLVFKFKLTTVFQSQSWTLDPIIAKMKRMNISGFLKVWFN